MINKAEAELFAETFHLQCPRKEEGEWVADDVYTMEKDGVEGVDKYTISRENFDAAIAEGDLDPFSAAIATVLGDS